MKFYKSILLLFISLLFFGDLSAQKVNTDSIRLARQKTIEETRAAQRHTLDSARAARQKVTDSLVASRKKVTDSLTAIRKHRESKKYQDSIARSRQGRLDSMRIARTSYADSLKSVRQHTIDSVTATRKLATDAIKAIQKARGDSLAAIRKYREGKRYKDSVAITRQQRLDSMQAVRKASNDSLFAERKKVTEEANAIRKASRDSALAVRTQYLDSLKEVRKVRTDSLAKAKESRERLKKSQERVKTDKMQLALELKIKKKHEAWNNEKMLKKKWSLPRQVIQNTFTRYNYYYNADKRMAEALQNMQRMNKSGYDSLIALYPFDPDRDSSTLAPDMDSIIQKASLGVQIHDPRAKWADDLYMLLGQAYYYKGNYENATASFRYIISIDQQNKLKAQKEKARRGGKLPPDNGSILTKEDEKFLDFLKHRPVHNEAILWLARVYTEQHRESDAEAILDLLDNDKDLPERLKGRVAIEKAYLALSKGDYRNASPQLTIAVADKQLPDWLRIRAAYLNGQILYAQGSYNDAASQFAKVVDLHPKIEMEFYARKNLSYSLMEQGGDQDAATASLKRMLNDGKYAPYYEQVYYVLGRLAANSGKTKDAVSFLQKSISSPKSTKKQKALSYASLGNLYYGQGDYSSAKLAYDSASQLSRYAAGDSLIIVAARRGGVLDEVAIPMAVIRRQDSLLRMAAMTEKERQAVARRYIRSLEQKRADSAFAAVNAGQRQQEEDEPVSSAAGSWYFANTGLMSQGANDFKRKWGNRTNVDNWRRSSATSGVSATASSNGASADRSSDEDDVPVGENGLPTEASLLAFVPLTTQQQEAARAKIQRAYVDLGTGYVNALEDYPRAVGTLDTLDTRYTNHPHKAEVMYLRYRIALKQNNLPEAQRLSAALRQQYANSEWAQQITPTDNNDVLMASAVPVANYYDETYGLMMQRQYGAVLQRVRDGQRQYKDAAYIKRFRIMEAIALAGSGNYSQADTLLTKFISANPSDSLKEWAESVMAYVNKNKPVVPVDSGAMKVAVPGTAKPAANSSAASAIQPAPKSIPVAQSGDTTAATTSPAHVSSGTVVDIPIPATYTYTPKAEHFAIFYFPKSEARAMGVKAGISDFNVFKYSGQGLSASLKMLKADQGIITVKKFGSAALAKAYIAALKGDAKVLREYKSSEYQIFIISAENFIKLEADKDALPYLKFYNNFYR